MTKRLAGMRTILHTKIADWNDHRLNMSFQGQHGVRKTAIVQETFERAGLRWRRFSSSRGKQPETFEDASVEAIFFNDRERLPKMLRSAVMDLVREGRTSCRR